MSSDRTFASALACAALFVAPAARAGIAIPFTTHRLGNGIEVLLAPDASVPVVALALHVKVGSADEPEGRTGFAHLFEHMMFQGSANVGKAQHFQFVNHNGGNVNGTTNADYTNYFEVLPSHRLALALWLEADRLRSLAVTPENFENQRQAVKEERRLRIDNQAYVPAFLRVNSLAYENFAYGHDVIGSMADLDAASTADAQGFFARWYVPANVVAVIAGDFDPKDALALAEHYLGAVPAREPPARAKIEEPPQAAERHEVMHDAHATLPAFVEAYHVPNRLHADYAPLEIAARVLTGGRSSRLHVKLVKEEQVAVTIEADLDGRRGPDLFNLWGICTTEPARVRDLVYAELERLAREGPGAAELEKVKNQARAEHVEAMQSVLHRALALGRAAAVHDDPTLVNRTLETLEKVTADDVKRVVAQYLVAANRTVIDVVPAPRGDGAQEVKP
jgi:predicted Zn-dependent peptidase